MKELISPAKLQPGDTVATISLSWGGAGELPHRYAQGKQQLEQHFGLCIVETENALKSAEWIANNPEARASDLMEAFLDPNIKAIISNIGGDDSIRTLPFMDLNIISNNPKIFLGFSDSTITHLVCYKAGLRSFYGTSVLVGFAENGGMHLYQINDIHRTLFSSNPVGVVEENTQGWTSERLEWYDISLSNVKRTLKPSTGWNYLQGNGVAQGKLLGGCIEVLEFLKGTEYWPQGEEWNNTMLFLETSEEMPSPLKVRRWLRNYAAQGILHKIKGLLFARPYHNQFVAEYNVEIQKVLREEGLENLPVVTEMDFGHTCPTFTIPFGITTEIDPEKKQVRFLEGGVYTPL